MTAQNSKEQAARKNQSVDGENAPSKTESTQQVEKSLDERAEKEEQTIEAEELTPEK